MFNFFRRKCECNDYKARILRLEEQIFNLGGEISWLRDAIQGLQTNEPVTTGTVAHEVATKPKTAKRKKK